MKSLQQTAPGLSLAAMVKGTSIGDLVLNVGAAAALVASRIDFAYNIRAGLRGRESGGTDVTALS